MLSSASLPLPLQYERRGEFDHVVIETTGLANPAPIIQTFFLEPSVADTMKLDGVVTLVSPCVALWPVACASGISSSPAKDLLGV